MLSRLTDDAGDLGLNVDGLAAVAVAIHREQHPGTGLAEALHHAGFAKSGLVEVQIARRLVVANMATTVSGILGR